MEAGNNTGDVEGKQSIRKGWARERDVGHVIMKQSNTKEGKGEATETMQKKARSERTENADERRYTL